MRHAAAALLWLAGDRQAIVWILRSCDTPWNERRAVVPCKQVSEGEGDSSVNMSILGHRFGSVCSDTAGRQRHKPSIQCLRTGDHWPHCGQAQGPYSKRSVAYTPCLCTRTYVPDWVMAHKSWTSIGAHGAHAMEGSHKIKVQHGVSIACSSLLQLARRPAESMAIN